MTLDHIPINDLPLWMRPRRRVIDWGLLIVLAASLFVAFPLLIRHGIPAGNNAELYALRSLEIARMVRGGILFSRWAPDLNYLFGSPLFNYLAPLPHYLPGFHQAFTDTNPIDSVNGCLALAILAAGTGMFLFARQRWGVAAGMIAALVYLFSPPVALSLPYLAGELAPLMALGLLPWVLWSFDRLWLAPYGRNWLGAVLLLGGLILSDTRVAGLSVPILLLSLVTERSLSRNGSYRPILLAVLAAAMLTAFFWLPALAERDQIHWLAVAENRQPETIPLTESLSMPHLDARILNEPVFQGVGVGTWIMALTGAVAILWGARRHTLPLDGAAFLLVGLVFLGLSSPAFSSLWSSPSEFQAILPYHAILIAVFCFAAASAQAASLVRCAAAPWRGIALSALCLAAPLAASSTLYLPPHVSPDGNLDFLTGVQDELQGYHIGTFRDGVLLPAFTPVLPLPPSNLFANLQSDSFARIDHRSFAASSQINLIEHTLQSDRYVFDMSSTGPIQFNLLYYPGWVYSLNGERHDVQPSPAGLVTVIMPASTGELALWLEGTPVRYLAWFITTAGIILLFFVARRLSAVPTAEEHPALTGLLPGRQALILALVLTLCATVTLWMHERAPDSGASAVAPLPKTFPGDIRLLGYDLHTEPDRLIRLTLFWQTDGAGVNSVQPGVQLVAGDGNQAITSSVHRYPGGIPAARWMPGDIVRDDYMLAVPPDLKPDYYRLKVQLGTCDSVVLLPCMNAASAGESSLDPSSSVFIPQTIAVNGQGLVDAK